MYDTAEEFNPKEKKTFAKFMMRFIDCFLVRNDVPFFGKLSKKIRCFLARRISKGIEKGAVIEKGAIIVPGVSCEAHACIGIGCVTCWGLHIEKHTMMGPNCRFFSHPHKRATSGHYVFRGFENPRPIYIKRDCWVGYNSIIMGGVTISEGCTIGAGSVVTKSIPPFSLAAGNPAVVKKTYHIPEKYYSEEEK